MPKAGQLVIDIDAGTAKFLVDMDKANAKLGKFGRTAHDAGSGLRELVLEGLGAAGLAYGFAELGKEALTAYASIERATVSLKALTGSGEAATGMIERLEALAKDEALPLPALISAAQRMTAMGFAAGQVMDALKGAANAAGATGETIEEASDSIERVALSGMASSRVLVRLGLSSEDLGKVLGVTGEKAEKAFKGLDQADRLEALTIALGKFAGVADAQAATMSGSWQELKNTMHGFFVQLGEDAAPAIGFLERLGTTTANVLKDSFSDIPNIDSLKILIEALQQGQSYEEARKKYQPVAAKIFELPDEQTGPLGKDKIQAAVRNERDPKADSDAKKLLAQEEADLKSGYAMMLDDLKADHKLTLQEETDFWQTRLAEVDQRGSRYKSLHREISNTLGHLYQDQFAESAKAMEHWNEEIAKGFDETDKAWKEATARGEEYAAREVEAMARVAEISAGSKGKADELGIEGNKLTLERQYGLEVGHTLAQQLDYMRKNADLDHEAREAKIAGLEAERAVVEKLQDETAKKVKLAELEAEIAALRGEDRNKSYAAQTGIDETAKNGSLSAQIDQRFFEWNSFNRGTAYQSAGQSAMQLPAALANALASGIFGGGKKGEDVGTQIKKAMEGIGKELFGNLLSQALEKLIAEIAVNVFGITLQSSATTANTVASTANTAALVALTAALTGSAAVSAAGGAAGAAGGLSGLLGPLKSLFGPLLSMLGFAGGGSPPIGVPSIFGEHGIEMWIPREAGYVVPNHRLSSYAAGGSYRSSISSSSSSANNTFHIYGGGNPREVARQVAVFLKSTSPSFSPASR